LLVSLIFISFGPAWVPGRPWEFNKYSQYEVLKIKLLIIINLNLVHVVQ